MAGTERYWRVYCAPRGRSLRRNRDHEFECGTTKWPFVTITTADPSLPYHLEALSHLEGRFQHPCAPTIASCWHFFGSRLLGKTLGLGNARLIGDSLNRDEDVCRKSDVRVPGRNGGGRTDMPSLKLPSTNPITLTSSSISVRHPLRMQRQRSPSVLFSAPDLLVLAL